MRAFHTSDVGWRGPEPSADEGINGWHTCMRWADLDDADGGVQSRNGVADATESYNAKENGSRASDAGSGRRVADQSAPGMLV